MMRKPGGSGLPPIPSEGTGSHSEEMIELKKWMIAAAGMAALVLFSTNVLAATLTGVTAGINSDTRRVTVTGQVIDPAAEQEVTMRVRQKKDGATLPADLANVSQQEVTSADGTFTIAVTLDEATVGGDMQITVGGTGLEPYTTVEYYADDNERATVLGLINGAESVDELHGYLVTYSDPEKLVLNIDLSAPEYVASQAAIDKILLDSVKKKPAGSVADVLDYFAAAFMVNAMPGVTDGEYTALLQEYQEQLKLYEDGKYKFYTQNADVAQQAADAAFAEAFSVVFDAMVAQNIPTDSATLLDAYRTAYALTKLNGATRAEIVADDGILETYNDVFGLDLTGRYLKVDKGEVAKALEGRGYTTVAAVQDDFRDALAQLPDATPEPDPTRPPSYNGGGGGGGGGRPSGSFEVAPIASQPPVTPAPEAGFADLSDAEWAREAVEALVDREVLNGMADGMFHPNEAVTRAQFTKMLVTAFDLPVDGTSASFADVDVNGWYYPYVAAAVTAGVAQGDGAIFRPDAIISRQEMATMLYRAMQSLGLDVSAIREYEGFLDADAVAQWAAEAVETLYCRGVINGMGDGTFQPAANSTRAQAAQMIYGVVGGVQ